MPVWGRRVIVPATVPHWVTLVSGLLLGCVLTSTFTFHLRWCSDKVALSDLSLERQTVSIIKVNEHIRAHGKGISVDGQQWEQNVDGQESEREDCICGEQLKKLRKSGEMATSELKHDVMGSLDPTFQPSSLVTKPSVSTFHPILGFTNSSQDILDAGSSVRAEAQPGKEQLLSEEFLLRRSFVVAVNVHDNGLKWASEIFDTWGQDVPQIIFFISSTCNKTEPESVGLPLVEIAGVNGSSEASVQKSFAILSYLHENYQQAFHWFVLVGTKAFVQPRRVKEVLSRLDPSSEVYLGWGAKGRPEDAEFLQLLPHEVYCLGTPGVVLSNAALSTLGLNLPRCLLGVERHNREGSRRWTNWDVELGRCVSRTVGVQCSQSAEVS